jgi:acetyl-CoA carboxylase biotin carboxyl carrier protein
MSDNEKFDFEQIRAVIRLAAESDIAELEVESPTLRVLVKKTPGGVIHVSTPPPHASRQASPHVAEGLGPTGTAPEAAGPESNHLKPITAPMVGTFYRAASPDAPPFVDEGDVVEQGQTVCIIEAMKLFNEIQSELPGRVVKVLTENGVPVEYGQPLFLIDPGPNGA